MEKEKFEKIISGIQNHINSQLEIVGKCNINGGSISIENLTVKEMNKLIHESRILQSSIDQIITADLYHLLAMGGLSSSQATILIKKVKELTTYRNLLKTLSTMQPITKSITLRSEYKSKTLEYSLQV